MGANQSPYTRIQRGTKRCLTSEAGAEIPGSGNLWRDNKKSCFVTTGRSAASAARGGKFICPRNTAARNPIGSAIAYPPPGFRRRMPQEGKEGRKCAVSKHGLVWPPLPAERHRGGVPESRSKFGSFGAVLSNLAQILEIRMPQNVGSASR